MQNKISCTLLSLLTIFCATQMIFPPEATHAASLHLAWNGNVENDLSGYNVYYTSSETYGDPLNVGNVTEYELSGLTEGVTYQIAITAYDIFNNESAWLFPKSDNSTESAPELLNIDHFA